MKAKESSISRLVPYVKTTTLTLDDVERLAKGNRKERRIAVKLLRRSTTKEKNYV